MGSKHLRTDINFAYPTAEIAVMGPEGAVNILYRRELSNAPDAEKVRQHRVDEYRDRFANPFVAAERGYIDDVIEPHETRVRVIRALRMLAHKVDSIPRKKHGNIPCEESAARTLHCHDHNECGRSPRPHFGVAVRNRRVK